MALEHSSYKRVSQYGRLPLFLRLEFAGAMIAVVSMVRRGSVVVSFMFGAIIFHEKNLKAKALDVLLVIIGMVFLYIGSGEFCVGETASALLTISYCRHLS